MSHGRVARKRYKSIDHRGPVEELGQGLNNGPPEKESGAKKHCLFDRVPGGRAYAQRKHCGICHTTRVNAETVQHTAVLSPLVQIGAPVVAKYATRERRANCRIPIQKIRTVHPSIQRRSERHQQEVFDHVNRQQMWS